MIKKNHSLNKPSKISQWRKIALGTWNRPGDPTVYGAVEFRVDKVLDYLEQKSDQNKITLTHFLGKAMGLVIQSHPEINVLLRYGRLYPRKQIDCFFQVANDGDGRDLSGTVVRTIDQMSLKEIAESMKGKVKKIRLEGDPDFKKMKSTMNWIPGFLMGFVLRFTETLMSVFNIWSPLLGVPKDPFGSMMITNVGSLGLTEAYAPLVPYSRVPMLLVLGKIKKTVLFDEKLQSIVAADTVKICVTVDHRIIDGLKAAKMAKALEAFFENPERVS